MTGNAGANGHLAATAVRGSYGELLAEIEAHAARIAGEAGALLLELYRTPIEVEYKDKQRRDPVSQADRRAEAQLRAAILERFPEHAILGEEGEDSGSPRAEYTWVLDPLDGTTNYVNNLPLFCVSVGVLRWGHPAVGAIWTPVAPDGAPGVFSARAGGGARLNGQPISVDGRAGRSRTLSHRLAGYPGGFGAFFALTRRPGLRPGEPRTLGSIAYEAALVAAGVLQSAIFWSPKIWDIAAAVTIVREAGGSALTRTEGHWHELSYFRPGIDPKTGADRPLRDWSGPLVIGAPELAQPLVLALRPTLLVRVLRLTRHPIVRRTLRLLRRLKSGPAASRNNREGRG
jgi:myo-inositol-1(or 4)-monophosphatase